MHHRPGQRTPTVLLLHGFELAWENIDKELVQLLTVTELPREGGILFLWVANVNFDFTLCKDRGPMYWKHVTTLLLLCCSWPTEVDAFPPRLLRHEPHLPQ